MTDAGTASATADLHRVVDAVWRMESARIVGALTRVTGDVGLAEELAQDALVAALEQWPDSGVPAKPGAWLMATAKHRAIDAFRRAENLRRKTEVLGRELVEAEEPDWAAQLDEVVEDDVLRLVFISCHPVLSREARVALTLRLVGGLGTAEIARAFLVPEPTLAQRIVRAKRTLSAARVPFEMPTGADFTARLGSVLEVVYLVFNEGYSATAGEDLTRPALCQEAMRLGRILAGLVPGESEVHGLVSLMEVQASRLAARLGPDGAAVTLAEQDRSRWDRVLVNRGLAALDRAEATAQGALGPYALQAAIAACHARARSVEDTDWPRIAALYEALAQLTGSPVVELNRAVAVSRAYGPAAGLEVADALVDVPALRGYHLLPAVRGDLLASLGRGDEARAEFERAAGMTGNEREREVLLRRAGECGGPKQVPAG